MSIKAALLGAFLAIGALSAPAEAAPQPSIQGYLIPIQDRDRQQNVLPLLVIRDIVARNVGGGRLIRAQLEDEHGPRPYYAIRWEMPDGQIRDFTVDAVSGSMR